VADDQERTPEEWRALLRDNLSYPEEVKAGARRERRQAKKQHRDDARRNTTEWIRQERQRDPIRPVGALLIVVLILGLGLAARWLGSGSTTAHAKAAPAATATAAAPTVPTAAATASPTSAPSSSAPVDLTDPNHVAQEAVQLYLTRNPVLDQDHTASVERAAPYLEPDLEQNLSAHTDTAWEKLVADGGVATVTAVKVGPAAAGLPVDTPLRVWRQVTATVVVKGYSNYTSATVLQVEVTNDGGQWHVSRILGLGQ